MLPVLATALASPGGAQDSAPSVRGVVRDSMGMPLAGALVIPDELETRTDAQGAFRLDRVPPGPRLITIRLQGYATGSLRGSGERVQTQQPGSSHIVIWEKR